MLPRSITLCLEIAMADPPSTNKRPGQPVRALLLAGCIIGGVALSLAALCTYLRYDEYLVRLMNWWF